MYQINSCPLAASARSGGGGCRVPRPLGSPPCGPTLRGLGDRRTEETDSRRPASCKVTDAERRRDPPFRGSEPLATVTGAGKRGAPQSGRVCTESQSGRVCTESQATAPLRPECTEQCGTPEAGQRGPRPGGLALSPGRRSWVSSIPLPGRTPPAPGSRPQPRAGICAVGFPSLHLLTEDGGRLVTSRATSS